MIACCREETRFVLLTRSLVEDENRRDGHQIKAKEEEGFISLWSPLPLKKHCVRISESLFAICVFSVCS